jgi:fumarylacetoacetase
MNETHDAALESWVESANERYAEFPIQNLPFGRFRHGDGPPRIGVAIGDQIFETGEISLNALAARGRRVATELRLALTRELRRDNPNPPRDRLHPMSECEMLLPFDIGDYTDFYASIHHATNVGKMMRPDNPLLPNYKWLPIGYHGRASSVAVSGTPVRRPSGQLQAGSDPPVFAPSRQLDYECEVGFFIGQGNALGEPIPIAEAEDHLFGFCLLNDWSARDMQRWEYQPLGPFLAKSFATTISPWVVTLDALVPFRKPFAARPEGDPAPLPHLNGGDALDITIEVWMRSAKMARANQRLIRLSQTWFDQMYWNPAQMIAHHASNGCNLRPGDLLGSGTVSGPEKTERGCLLEITSRGTEPIELPSGEKRAFLEDGDEVYLRGYCERDGFRRIGFGECRGTLVP